MVLLDESSSANSDINYDHDSKPPTTPECACELVEQLYGFKIKSIRELNAYDDRNYYVEAEDGTEYVLKITNSVDTAKDGLLEGQNEMLLHLSLKGFNVPAPIKTAANSFITRLTLSSEHSDTSSSGSTTIENRLFAIRLLKWIPGKRFCDVLIGERQLEQAGDLLGRMKNALNGYENNSIRRRNNLWQLENVPTVRQHLHLLERSRSVLVERCIQEFERKVLENISDLPKSYNHGDFNEQNILVRDDDNNHDVFGIIDFGDICYGPRIFDVSLLIMYSMMLKFDADLDPIHRAPGLILRGYLRHCSIDENEFTVIVACIRARFCQSLVLGAYTHSLHPENDYLLVTAKVGWNILQQIGSMDDRTLADEWLTIAKSS